jgi:diguanylate cyclase (GGDEF)-like protein
MKLLPGLPGPVDNDDADPLEAYRDRAMYLMALVGVAILLPLVVHSFLEERTLLGAAIALVMALLSIDAVALHRRKRPPFPYALLLFPMAAAIGIALKTTGIVGGFCASPTVLFFYFVLRRGPANACSLAMLAAGSLMAYWWIGGEVAARFFLSFSLTIVMVNIILNIVGDLHRRLVEQAITDPLTETFNRRHMHTRLEEAIERGRRAGSQASLLIIDIDHFKAVNDRFGHEAGDHVLKELVSFLRERSRKADLLFRMGGEEFLLLLNDTGPEAAANVAEALREGIARTHFPVATPITVSIGVSGLEVADSVDSWVKRADMAMYAAKEAGRNRVMMRPEIPVPWPGTPPEYVT